MANVKILKQMLVANAKAGMTTNIIGRHGIGKSQIVHQVFESLGYKVIDIRLGQMADAGDLVGLPEFDRDAEMKAIATRFITPDRFPKKGEKAVIFFDEINRANKDILQAIFEIVLDKRMGDYALDTTILEDGVPMQFLVTAMNPATDDYATLDFSDKAFQDRFSHVKFEPTANEWLEYARAAKVPSVLTSFIADQTAMLEGKTQDFDLSEIKPSRRSWMTVAKYLELDLPKDVLIELMHGVVGVEAATTFQSFMANYGEVLKGEDILESYKKVQKKVQKYSTVENDRADILRNAGDDVLGILKEKGKITKTQQENLTLFLLDIPLDLGFSLVQKLIKGESVSIFTDKGGILFDERLVERFKKTNESMISAKAEQEEEK